MKKLLLVILLLTSAVAKEATYKSLLLDWKQSSIEQKETMYRVYMYSSNDDLSFSASAIAWEETSNGKYEIQLSDNSGGTWDCGLFGNNTKTVLDNMGLKHSSYNKKMICTDLVKDEFLSYKFMIKQIDYGKKLHGKNWRKIWGTYNGGTIPNKGYGDRIALRIQVIKYIIGTHEAKTYIMENMDIRHAVYHYNERI